MDKTAWISYATPLCKEFLQAPSNQVLKVTFGSSSSKDFIGQDMFQYTYDVVSSWTCWNDNRNQETTWNTKLYYTVHDVFTTCAEEEQEHTTSNYYVETDEQATCVTRHTHTPFANNGLQLVLRNLEHAEQLKCALISGYTHTLNSFKLKPSTGYTDVVVVKQARFQLQTHFLWTYEFNVVWLSPFTPDRDDENAPLTFLNSPRCQFTLYCEPCGVNPDVTPELLAESVLLKIHDVVPPTYRHTDGTSVCMV